MPSRLLSYLQLFRAPNVFTALADVMMGYIITRGGIEPPLLLGLLGVASALLYTAGMVLNDVFDVEQDARERPSRPIPSGRIPLGVARLLGIEMLVAGILVGWSVAWLANDLRPGIVASLLALAVWLYDKVLKRTPLAPLVMGSCRFLNVLLGMSVAGVSWDAANYTIAGGIGLYIVGVTWFARGEAKEQNSQFALTAAFLVMLAGIGLLYWFPETSERFTMPSRWEYLWLAVAGLIGWRAVRAIVAPKPAHIQLAIKHAIFGIFMLDAGVCLALGGRAGNIWPLAILLLAMPAMALGRWVYST